MQDAERRLNLIKELAEEVAEEAEPLWAWWAVHQLACSALGFNQVTPAGLEWALAKCKELGLCENDG